MFAALSRVTVAGHNLGFDLPFLAALVFTPGAVFDTMVVAQVIDYGTEVRWAAPSRFRLADVAKRF